MPRNNNITELIKKAREVFLASLDHNEGEIGDGWYDLGGRMAELHVKARAKPEFEGWCQEVGIAPRTAFYLMNTHNRLKHLRIEPPKGIGWRKLAEVAPTLRWENREKLFQLCRDKPRLEIVEIMKTWKN